MLYGIGEKKTSVAQVGLGYCDYYSISNTTASMRVTQQNNFFMDLGFIQSFGRLALNMGCEFGEYIVQPRIGVGFNFEGRH